MVMGIGVLSLEIDCRPDTLTGWQLIMPRPAVVTEAEEDGDDQTGLRSQV
jgi:hypothetical protein